MSTIVTRAGKGSALTWIEGDANITNLNNDKIEAVVDDTTPQLGGHLDVNGKQITSSSNGNIAIVPNGSGNISLTPATGHVTISAVNFPTGDGTVNQVLKTDGSGNLSWATVSASPAGSNTQIQFNNSGSFGSSSSLTFDGTNLSSPYVLVTNSSGDEGGEILLAKPQTNSTIAGTGVTIDVYQNKLRIFEQGGSARGAYIDLTAAATGVGTNLLSGGGGTTTLDGLSDVIITAAGTGDILYYNGTNWVDQAVSGITAGVASKVSLTATQTTNATHYILFSSTTTGDESPRTDTSITYNPSTNTLTTSVINVAGLTVTDAVTMSSANQVITMTPTNTSGTVTIAPGTLTGSIDNMTIGATTAKSGAFTTLSASSTVSGSGFSTYLASPPAIGGTAAAAGTFTNLSATGTLTFKQPIEAIYDLGTTGGTIAPNCTNGSVQKITLNSALTLNAFTSPVAGQSLTLIIYGGTAYTSITSTMKFAGGVKTLTGTAGCIDILSVYYDGTNYFASLGKGYA